MNVVTEPHPDGWGHRWRLLDRTTGQTLLTGTQAYSTDWAAEIAGARQLDAARNLPTPDTLEPA